MGDSIMGKFIQISLHDKVSMLVSFYFERIPIGRSYVSYAQTINA